MYLPSLNIIGNDFTISAPGRDHIKSRNSSASSKYVSQFT